MERREEVPRRPHLASEPPWAEHPLSSVASPGCCRDSEEDRHREGDVSCSPLCTKPVGGSLETCEPGAVGRKSWKPAGNSRHRNPTLG